MALVHYILTFHWVFVDNQRSNALRDTIISCVESLGASNATTSSCTLDVYAAKRTLAVDNEVAMSALLLVSVSGSEQYGPW